MSKQGEWFENEVCPMFIKSMGWETRTVFKTGYSQRHFGDFAVTLDGSTTIRVDAKAEGNPTGNFPVETVQDLTGRMRNSVGWIEHLKQCDEIWYGQFESKNLRSKLAWFIRVDVPKLKRLNLGSFRRVEVPQGSGLTECYLVPILTLKRQGIATSCDAFTSWYSFTHDQ